MGAGGDAMTAAMTVAVAVVLAGVSIVLVMIARDMRAGTCVCRLCEADTEVAQRRTATAVLTAEERELLDLTHPTTTED